MRRILRLLVVAVVLTTILTFVGRAKPVHAACTIFDITGPAPYSAVLAVGHTYSAYTNGVLVGGGPGTGETISGTIPAGLRYTLVDDSSNCGGGNGETFFNPGDARINGKPGDRLVVYCNLKPWQLNIEVYVIAPGGSGRSIAVLPFAKILGQQLVKNLGAEGTITATMDNTGAGFVTLKGGPYNATGQGDWLKAFAC